MARTKTPDFARLDDIDVYIQSTPMSAEEEKRFSEVLKEYREKDAARKSLHKVPTPPKRRNSHDAPHKNP